MATSDSTTEAQIEAASLACASQGAQLTPLRREVLRLVIEAGTPLTAYQLLDRLRQSRAGAAPPTIYRALDFLLANRLIHRIEMLNAFIPCVEAGQHTHAVQFLVCRRCGTVAEVEDHAVSAALEHAAEDHGFHAGKTVVEMEGTCAACMVASA